MDKETISSLIEPYLYLCWGLEVTTKKQLLEKIQTYCCLANPKSKFVFDSLSAYSGDVIVEWCNGGYKVNI